MPVSITDQREHGFDEPIGLLSDCHRRIEMFLGVLQTVAEKAHQGALSEEEFGALANALRYFREAAPKHTADESESLFPRLREAGTPDALAALARLEALELDHFRAETLHAEVERLGSRLLAEGSLLDGPAGRLRVLLVALSGLYRTHIASEEQDVFPLAERELSHESKLSMGAEMAARRGVPMRTKEDELVPVRTTLR